MKQLFIFLAGSLVFLLAFGLILSANIFAAVAGLLVIFFFCYSDFGKKFFEVSTKIDRFLETL